MTEDEKNEYFGDKNIQREVENYWNDVYEISLAIIRNTKICDFANIALAKPNIHEMIATLKFINGTLNLILSLNKSGRINVDDTRQIHNAKQQILMMQQIAIALENEDRDAYDYAVERLQKQAPF